MTQGKGKTSRVVVAEQINLDRDYSHCSVPWLLSLTESELSEIDPLAINLAVARAIPGLEAICVEPYQRMVNIWVHDFATKFLPDCERTFYSNPAAYKNDLDFFRLGAISHYVEHELGIEYLQDQRNSKPVLYTNASDVFMNGLLETRQGTCGNMAALQLAFAWRMQWPVSLTCVHSHFLIRFDDGQKQFNIEATQSGFGGFKSDPDEYLVRERNIPAKALLAGSDLKALTRKEILGVFVGLRGRHLQDVGIATSDDDAIMRAEVDYLIARTLFPNSRWIYKSQMVVSALRGGVIFALGEMGHPTTLAQCVRESESLIADWSYLSELVTES
jgi:hypothetical protein